MVARVAPGSAHQRAQDQWQRHLLRECALAIGAWLEQRGRLDQPISALRLHELEGMAWACTAKYADLREQRRIELRLPLNADPTQSDALDAAAP